MTLVRAAEREYRNFLWNSRRWDGFEFRYGDIIICTPPKCGTTWTQTIVGLLIFDSPDFPEPMEKLSPWFDMNTRPQQDVWDDLEAQTHRRFIKTHTPLDGLPIDDRVTYLCVGRDPRDATISMMHHHDNMDRDALIRLRLDAVGYEDLPDPGLDLDALRLDDTDIAAYLRIFTEADIDDPRFFDRQPLAGILDHFQGFWDHRHLPNVGLFHFADYQADLPADMIRMAALLDIDLTPSRAKELADHAGFDAMKARAAQVAPNVGQGFWLDSANFFHSGTSNKWSEHMTDDDVARYQARVNELVDDKDLARWAHMGTSQ